MKRDCVIEIVTYLLVFFAMWVLSPWVGKTLDRMYYSYPNLFTDSLLLVVIAGMIALLGIALVFWTIIAFKTIGKGTPNPKIPPKVLVISGPYRHSRNPMALGGFLFLMGESGIYQSPSLVVIAVLFMVILYINAVYIEEPELRKRFGQPYEKYFKSVPRFIPNLFRSVKG